jgi:hypothetical protein
MSVISDLIEKINDPDLRARLSEEVARMQKQIEGFRKKGYLDRRDDGSWHVLALNSRVE